MKSINSGRFLAKALLAICVLLSLAIAPAKAVLVTWDFNPGNLNAEVGSSSLTLTQSGYNLTVRGYDNVPGPDPLHNLFYKNAQDSGGAHERGLGLSGTPSNELIPDINGNPENYLQLDLRSLLSQGFTAGMVRVTSLQAGESFSIYGSNALGELGMQLGGPFAGLAFDDQFVAIPNFGAFQFISLAATTGRVLPSGFRAVAPIPEMSTLFPILGLLAAISMTSILRRRRAVKA